MMRLLVLLCITGAVVAAPIPLDEKYSVKLTGEPQVGTVTVEKRYSKNVMTMKFTDAQGMALPEMKSSEIKDMEYEETVLKVEKGKAVRFSRKYTRATVEDDGGKHERSYLKRTVLYEWKDGKYTVSVGEGEKALPEEEVAELEKEINEDPGDKINRALEPAKAVKIGDVWNPDGKKVAEAFNGDPTQQYDGENVKTTAKLLKAYKNGKNQWGVIELTFDLPLKSLEGLTIAPGTAMTMKGTMDGPIDGSTGGTAKMTGTGKVKGSIDNDGQVMQFEGSSEFTTENSTTLKK